MGGESERRSGEDGPGGALKDIGDQLQPKSEDEGPYEEPRYSKIDDKRPKYHPPADSTMSGVMETVKTSNNHQKQSPGVIGRITQSLNPFGSSDPSTTPEKVNEKHPSQKSETSREKKLRKSKAAYDRLFDDYRKLKRTKEDLETELDEERDVNKTLRQDIKNQEGVVTEAHSRAISLLAGHVSSDFPDDQVRTELQDLFEKCSEWCMDNRLPRITNVEETRKLLLTEDIVNDLDCEEHLRFDMTHRTATAILLQAALTKRLLQIFLSDPFFLGQNCLHKTALQGGASAEATVTWRIQTCQYLEQAFPPQKQALQTCAENFAKAYQPLIEPLDRESLTQLTKLFETTCSLALRLWKLRTNIRIEALGDATLHRFQSMFGDMEAHPTVGLLKGDKRFDGRPICVVVRPRIVSEPVESENRGRGIVWSPAQVWVSNWEDAGY
ncbi:hypothetical protein FOC1_g10008808 [Fusarium oxysporum f. sp. cubense race 1]|uniref:Uncharacterized protein n=1 Tax=Fusarium oxysporum f. sp. cubense (strain race 1) TaxID=1229664 RepID=N4UBW4_FUSC1|nr:hypothetical protein FOC1_g10008808 [Fusarium oxysporum f. sp. cubense race 1]